MCKRTARTNTHSHCRMSQLALMFCPGRDRDRRDGARRRLVDCLTTQCFRFCSGTPLPPHPWKSSKWDSPRCTGQSWLDRPIGFQMGEEWAVTKTQRKRERGPNSWQHTARSKKRYVLVKNKHVWCLSGALQQKGKKEMSLFSIIIQTCSTKTTNHIHKPLIGTVYLSENIIEPKNKKSCFFYFLKVSLDNKQVRHLKVSSVRLWQVHWSVFKTSPFLQTGLKGLIFHFSSLSGVYHSNSCSSTWMFLSKLSELAWSSCPPRLQFV